MTRRSLVSLSLMLAGTGRAASMPHSVGPRERFVRPTPPAQAAAAGFTKLVFNDDFTDASTICGHLTRMPIAGVNWYANVAQTSGKNYNVLTTATAASITNGNNGGGSYASPNGGIWEIMGVSSMTYNANFQSVPPPNGPGPNAWKHAYFECYMQFNIDQSSPLGWPAFWSWSELSHEVAEVDFMESGFYRQPPAGGRGDSAWTIHDPGGQGGLAVVASGSMQPSVDSDWHVYGCLWKNTGSDRGTLDFYFDNTHVAGPISTGHHGGTVPDMETIAGQYLVVGTGVGIPIYIDWARVWQA